MCKVLAGFFVLVAGVALAASSARAADAKFNLDGDKSDSAKPGAAKTDKPDSSAKKDPVELAFVLPKGAVLRPDQQKAFDKMKKEFEPKLKDALDKVESATLDQDKSKAAHEVLHIRQDIKAEIKKILAMPDPNPPQPQQPKKRRGRYYFNY